MDKGTHIINISKNNKIESISNSLTTYVSKKSIPWACRSPQTQSLAFNVLAEPSGFRFRLKTHVLSNMFTFCIEVISVSSQALFHHSKPMISLRFMA